MITKIRVRLGKKQVRISILAAWVKIFPRLYSRHPFNCKDAVHTQMDYSYFLSGEYLPVHVGAADKH